MGLAALTKPARLPASSFDEFAASRPEGETWEQIDGLFVMQATPSIPHTVIASNIERLLNDALATTRPDLIACREVTIVMEEAGILGGNYVPDVAVLDEADLQAERSKTAICHLAVEVVSPSDRKPMVEGARSRIEVKIEGYQNLPSCEAVLVVEQSEVRATLLLRTGQVWSEAMYDTSHDMLSLPQFGLRCALSDFYARTPALRAVSTRPRRP